MLHEMQLWMLLAAFHQALALPAAAPLKSDTLSKRATDIEFATSGDSWASGVTYAVLRQTNYDDNKGGCMRVKHGYGPHLAKDPPTGVKSTSFTFPACSGSHLVDMARGHEQMKSGGNYGAEFPAAGPCTDAINAAEAYLSAPHDRSAPGTWRDTRATIVDVFDITDAGKEPGFKLFVLGYAHYFNTDSPESGLVRQIQLLCEP
ncbi:hypothetical protein LTR95_015907 [Oleoguttula sp. CCFEE 5521]